jgi:hypothetical protein
VHNHIGFNNGGSD